MFVIVSACPKQSQVAKMANLFYSHNSCLMSIFITQMPPLTFTVYFGIFLLPLLYKNSKSHRGFSAWADKTLRSWSQSDSNIVWEANPYQMELNCEQNCSIVVHQPSLSAWFSDEAIGKTSKNRWLQTEQERREEKREGVSESLREKREKDPYSWITWSDSELVCKFKCVRYLFIHMHVGPEFISDPLCL